jgi:phage baseplate assembly protein W
VVIDLFRGPDGDFGLDGQNDLRLVSDDEELMQCITDIILTNLGEWKFNPLHGFARFDVLGHKYNQERATEELIAAILQEPRVSSVENVVWDFDRQSRKLTGTYKVIKQTGETLEGGF